MLFLGEIQNNRISRYKILKKHDYLEKIFHSGGRIYEERVVFEGAYLYPWAVIEYDIEDLPKMFKQVIRSIISFAFYSEKENFERAILEGVNYGIKKGRLITNTEKLYKISCENGMYPIAISCRVDEYETNDDRYFYLQEKLIINKEVSLLPC